MSGVGLMTRPVELLELLSSIPCACCGAEAEPVPSECGHCFCISCHAASLRPPQCPICVESMHPLPEDFFDCPRHEHP